MIPSDGDQLPPGFDVLEFALEGGGTLDDVPAEDVGAFIVELARVVARAAGHALGRPVKDTGRFESLVKAASQVRLKSVASGSVVVTISPSRSETFRLGDNLGLDAQDVSQRALEIARHAVNRDGAERYPDVARAWVDLSDRVGVGRRYERIAVKARHHPAVILDAAARQVLLELSDRTSHGTGTDVVRGVLFAADFEKLAAKLRLATGAAVDVTFDLEHAESIKHALRNLTTVAGHASYDRRTNRLLNLRLEQINEPVQLRLTGEFWTEKSAQEILVEQGVQRTQDPDWFRIAGLEPEEWDSFMAAFSE